jgi:hypothetical protein
LGQGRCGFSQITGSETKNGVQLNATFTTPKAAATWGTGWPYHLAGLMKNSYYHVVEVQHPYGTTFKTATVVIPNVT